MDPEIKERLRQLFDEFCLTVVTADLARYPMGQVLHIHPHRRFQIGADAPFQYGMPLCGYYNYYRNSSIVRQDKTPPICRSCAKSAHRSVQQVNHGKKVRFDG